MSVADKIRVRRLVNGAGCENVGPGRASVPDQKGAPALINDVIAQYIACYNARDIDGMLEFVTEDVVFENISNTGQSMRLEGREAMRSVAELSGNAFSYRRQKLINMIALEDRAAAEVEFEGKAAVDLPNGTRAGETVRVRGASFFEFRGNRLSRIADYS